jgi:hypothetical protein
MPHNTELCYYTGEFSPRESKLKTLSDFSDVTGWMRESLRRLHLRKLDLHGPRLIH